MIAPQAASTATVGGHFTVLLVLGIPGESGRLGAVILGALLIHNVRPGPQIFEAQAELIYTIIAALLVGAGGRRAGCRCRSACSPPSR